ncbi:hypothetical protein SR187_1300 [Streptococcus ruminantium]|uniref:Uncharacterized protein n=1 Tax=Streptococcus ruminantium TaxID=1917441 RepID=A0A2Z5TX06_9STRE|nr:hypothetical protein SR187_1300 [Streptococcus ruminantium]
MEVGKSLVEKSLSQGLFLLASQGGSFLDCNLCKLISDRLEF